MPIYEYRCSSCGHELESLQKLADAPLLTCPSCHADALVKLVSASAFQLKGSGWYATDFKGGSKPAVKTEDSAKAGGDATSGAKAETTPGEKAEPKVESKSESKSESKPESKSEQRTETASPPASKGPAAS